LQSQLKSEDRSLSAFVVPLLLEPLDWGVVAVAVARRISVAWVVAAVGMGGKGQDQPDKQYTRTPFHI